MSACTAANSLSVQVTLVAACSGALSNSTESASSRKSSLPAHMRDVVLPPFGAGPALIVVGCLMVSTARFIDFENIQEAFPAFVTMAIMPFTFSISNGLLAGLAATFALWVLDMSSIGRELLQSLVHRSDPGRKKPGEAAVHCAGRDMRQHCVGTLSAATLPAPSA